MNPKPTVMVIFGGGGDLSWRKLIPALYNLFLDKWLPKQFHILGVDRLPLKDEEYHRHLREGADQFSRRKPTDADWKAFTERITYLQADITKPDSYGDLRQQLVSLEKEWKTQANRVYYLATSPTLVQMIVQQLNKAELAGPDKPVRIVVEKPFGRDLPSASALNHVLTSTFAENQVYRIDH